MPPPLNPPAAVGGIRAAYPVVAIAADLDVEQLARIDRQVSHRPGAEASRTALAAVAVASLAADRYDVHFGDARWDKELLLAPGEAEGLRGALCHAGAGIPNTIKATAGSNPTRARRSWIDPNMTLPSSLV